MALCVLVILILQSLSFYVYILQSQQDQSFYIGFTGNLANRICEHNEGSTRYTSRKRPWILVYSEVFNSKTEAQKRELAIKRKKSRKSG